MRTSPNFFPALPPDILQHTFSWLNLHGPKVKLIESRPTENQKSEVLASSTDAPKILFPSDDNEVQETRAKTPDLSTYHLIKDYDDTGESVYKIGFCKRGAIDEDEAEATADDSLTYEVVTLDPKSPLLRYVTEDFQDSKYSKLFPYDSENECNASASQDRLLLKYIELEIKAAGGLTCRPLQNRIRLAGVCQDVNAWMNGYTTQTQARLFERSIKQDILDELLHHIAYDERDEARAILKPDPSLLLSTCTGNVTDCSPERTFPKTTAFQLAVWSGNWRMWEMMLDVVNTSPKLSDDERVAYRADLLEQRRVVEEEGLEYTLDNLLNKGLRILDAQALQESLDEDRRLKADIVDRNAYHLIIKKDDDGAVISCVLGYRDPATGAYTQHSPPQKHELFEIAGELHQSLQDANDGHGERLNHFVTRANRYLSLVKLVLGALKIETQLTLRSAHLDLTALEPALKNRMEKFFGWSAERQVEDWQVTISASQRLFPAQVWPFWMSNNLPYWEEDEEMLDYIQKEVGGVAKNILGGPVLPISSFLGTRLILLVEPYSWEYPTAGLFQFLKSVVKVALQKRSNLSDALKANPTQDLKK